MNINAIVRSITGKMVVIAYMDSEGVIPNAVQVYTPKAFKNWEVEPRFNMIEMRVARNTQEE